MVSALGRWGLVLFLLALTGAHAKADNGASIVQGSIRATPAVPWVGEIFDLNLEWHVDRDAFRALDGELIWDTEPLVALDWDSPRLVENPQRHLSTIIYTRQAIAAQPGRLDLSPASIGLQIQTGSVVNDDYRRAILESRRFTSPAGALSFRPLPPAPRGFRGFVGKATLESRIEPQSPRVGEPVKWTLVLSGRGNWPMFTGLPARLLGDAFAQQGAPTVRQTGVNRFEQRLEETLSAIPLRAGQFSFPQFEWVFFDPELGRYQTIRSPELVFEVAPGDPSQVVATNNDYMATPTESESQLVSAERLATAPLARAFDSRSRWLIAALLILLWLALAAFRAWFTDPWRRARAADRKLRRILASLQTPDSESDPVLSSQRRVIRDWQRECAQRWRLDQAAPTAEDFSAVLEWTELWCETDRFLFGPPQPLAADWVYRAEIALERLEKPPGFALKQVFVLANWLPGRRHAVVGMALLAVLLSANSSLAATAVETWGERVQQQPLDVNARGNLAVVLRAEGRLQEAAVHAGIAWLQEPRVSRSRELWVQLQAEAGLVSAERGGLMQASGFFAQMATVIPGTAWQRIAMAAEAMLILTIITTLILSYLGAARASLRLSGFVLLLSAFSLFLSQAVLWRYGLSLAQQAALVSAVTPLRDLPVDTFAEQESAQVQPGALGVRQRDFMDWTLIRLADGRSGWVRKELLVGVWSGQ